MLNNIFNYPFLISRFPSIAVHSTAKVHKTINVLSAVQLVFFSVVPIPTQRKHLQNNPEKSVERNMLNKKKFFRRLFYPIPIQLRQSFATYKKEIFQVKDVI